MSAHSSNGFRSNGQLDVRLLFFRHRPGREEPVMLAQDLLSRGRLEDALAVLDAALEREPDDVELIQTGGELFFALGEVLRAQRLFVRAARMAPEWVAPWTRLAELLIQREKFERAALSASRAVEAAPHDPQAKAIRRRALRFRDLFARLEAYREDPEGDDPSLLARELLAMGRPTEASEVLDRADPDDPDVCLLQAELAQGNGDLAAARIALERATRADAAWAEPWTRLASLLADTDPKGAETIREHLCAVKSGLHDVLEEPEGALVAAGTATKTPTAEASEAHQRAEHAPSPPTDTPRSRAASRCSRRRPPHMRKPPTG